MPFSMKRVRPLTPLHRLLPLLLACTLAVPAIHAQTALPAGGEPLLPADAVERFELVALGRNASAMQAAIVDASGPGFSQAWRVETTRDTSPPWAIQLRTRFRAAVRQGDAGLVRFFARAPRATDETGAGRVRIAVQRGAPQFRQSADGQFSIGPDWQEYLVRFTFAGDYAAGEAELVLNFGYKRQTIEVGGCEVLNYGDRVAVTDLPRTRFTYAGREPDAAWRQEALARIERIRKGDFEIAVVDAAGRPVSGAKVRIEQRRSAFQWGTAVQFARLVNDTPENLIYREKLLELFNAASPENDLKWPVWIGEWDEQRYNQEQSLAALRWLRDQNLHLRGHVFVWPSWRNLPRAIGELRDTPQQAEIPARVLAHIADIAGATRAYINEWDVLNEPWDNHDLMDIFGDDIMVDWFVAARKALPTGVLYLNDYSNHDATTDGPHVAHFEKTARFLLDKKAPLTGLGIQAHIGSTPNAPVNVLAVLDRYAKFNLPIRITELDIDTDDEELQADYTRDFLILMFSHPSVVGVQHWGFWERAHWRPRGALYRADWSEKPNAAVYKSLVLDQWRTKLDGNTRPDGRFIARGFHGDYVAVVESAERRAEKLFSIPPGDPRTTVKVELK